MQGLVDIWVDVQSWILETAVHPLLFRFGYMTFFEDAPFVVETLMLGVVQIAVILLVFRPLERLAPAEQWPDRKLARVDIVYTLLSKLGVLPFVVFIVLYPVNDWLQDLVRDYDLVLPTVEQSVPWLRDKPLLLFATYFLLYDFAGYWLHRMQHAFPWWWALHSLHHSQRQVTCWSDDRNHLIDDLLASVYFAVVALLIGVQPGQYVILLLLSRMVESLSHANVRFGFGRMLDKVLVPRHRDYDGLPLSQSRIGKSCGGTRTSMLRAMPGWRRINPARSRVSTIWWIEGGVTWKWRCMSASAGA